MVPPLEQINLLCVNGCSERREQTLARYAARFQQHGQVLASSAGLLNAPMSNPDPQDGTWAPESTEEGNASAQYTPWARLMRGDSFFQTADGKWERRLGHRRRQCNIATEDFHRLAIKKQLWERHPCVTTLFWPWFVKPDEAHGTHHRQFT